jgi:hypothetical protein
MLHAKLIVYHKSIYKVGNLEHRMELVGVIVTVSLYLSAVYNIGQLLPKTKKSASQ